MVLHEWWKTYPPSLLKSGGLKVAIAECGKHINRKRGYITIVYGNDEYKKYAELIHISCG